jgi:hypothetical protein
MLPEFQEKVHGLGLALNYAMLQRVPDAVLKSKHASLYMYVKIECYMSYLLYSVYDIHNFNK